MIIGPGCVATIHFFLYDDKGNLLDSSESFGPLTFVHGKSKILPALETIIQGKQKGDSFSATFSPKEAYGQKDETLIKEFSLDQLPKSEHKLEVGALFQTNRDNTTFTMRIIKIDENLAVLDGNHPFAGKTLNYKGTILEVREATYEEMKTGFAFS
jgi:FKBP-type peptidyl-prolyl cis-trans isomerase SlyD